jgi:hypothetical protein
MGVAWPDLGVHVRPTVAVETGMTIQDAVNAGGGTGIVKLALLASFPLLQCSRQSAACAASMPAQSWEGAAEVAGLTTTGCPWGLNIIEHACAAVAPWSRRSPSNVNMATARRVVLRMAGLHHRQQSGISTWINKRRD